MKHTEMSARSNRRMAVVRALAACIALGCVPAYAGNISPPGSHTWSLDKTSNPAVDQTTTNPRTITGVPDLLYGRDFIIGGKGTTTFSSTAAKTGYVPIAVGPSQSSTACSTGACTATVTYSTSSCSTLETSYGITATTDIPNITSLTFSKQTVWTYRSCSSDSSSASQTIAKGSIASGYKVYPILAIGYKNATARTSGPRIVFSSSINNSANDTNSTLWTKVYTMCKALGWSPPTTSWTSARDVVKQTGFCYLGTTKVLGGTATGAQPFERVATYPRVLESATRVVGTYYASTSY